MASVKVATESTSPTVDMFTTTRQLDTTVADLTTETMNTTTTNDLIGGRHTVVGVIFIALVAVVLMVLTVGGNLLVIIAYRVNRRLRSVNNLFLVSLACSDLVIGVVSMNLYPFIIITSNWPFGEVACDIWLSIDYTLSMASVANLMLICLDRYFSVTRPFTYRSKRSRLKAKIAIILAWIFSMLLWAPAIMIWPRVQKRTVKEGTCTIQFFENPVITSVTAVLAFYLPVIIMIILYWRIFMETRRCRQYLEYLRSYKISHPGHSPSIKRKVSAQNSAPSSTNQASDPAPRRRINSTPVSSFRSAAPIWRPDPVQENPDEPPCEKTTPFLLHKDSRKAEKDRISPKNDRSSDCGSLNNNYIEDKEPPSRQSRFKRLKQALFGSMRNSLREAATGSCNAKDEVGAGQTCTRRDTNSSCFDQSHTLSSSRRSSSGCTSPCSGDKNESCALLEADNNVAGRVSPQNRPGTTSPPSARNKKLVVPIIVTTDEAAEARAPCLARRTRSEGDEFSSGASLTVPHATVVPKRETPAEPAASGPGKIPSNDRKAARTLSAILLAFVVTWLPYNVCVLYSSFCQVHDCKATIPQAVWDFAYYLCYINSTLNPFCYAACNKTFRNTFLRLLTCSGRRSQPRRIRCCFNLWRNRDRHTDTITMQPSTSSSRSVPPSPLFKKRESSST